MYHLLRYFHVRPYLYFQEDGRQKVLRVKYEEKLAKDKGMYGFYMCCLIRDVRHGGCRFMQVMWEVILMRLL